MSHKKKNKNKIKRICKNCKLYNPEKSICSVIILYDGQKINLPVDPEDPCFFEEKYFNPITGNTEDYNDIQEVRLWVEDPETGIKGKQGIVKIQYPEGFFGKKP